MLCYIVMERIRSHTPEFHVPDREDEPRVNPCCKPGHLASQILDRGLVLSIYLSFDRSKPGTCPGTKQRFFATFPSSACPIRSIHELV